jgi:hypothetical protein
LDPHDTLSFNEVGDCPFFADPSSLIPEASSVSGTPGNYDVVDWNQLVGFAIRWWGMERGNLIVTLHYGEDVPM